MAAANRDAALAFVIEVLEDLSVNENEPASVGGISKGGVTLGSYAGYCAKAGLPKPTADTIRALSEDQMKAFYAAEFCDPLRFDDLPTGADAALLGYAVQAGLTGGVRLLSFATRTWPIPPRVTDEMVTLAHNVGAEGLIASLGAAWLAQKFDSGRWGSYGHGWTNRAIKQDDFSNHMMVTR